MKSCKKIILCLLAALLLLMPTLVSCRDGGDGENSDTEVIYHTVVFNSNGGSAVPSEQVPHRGHVAEPTPPTLENRVFKGWMLDGQLWSFDRQVTEDITLTASWENAGERFEYTVENGTVTVTGLKSTAKDQIIVPATIAGFPVTAIGEGAFADLNAATVPSISLPATVQVIGAYAFSGCEGIELSLSGASLIFVGENAFEDCDGLKAISFGNGLTEIAPSAFLMCSSLSAVSLPKTVTSIGESAFEGCEALSSILLPSSLSEIGHSAFRDCDKLETVLYEGTEAQWEALLAHTEEGMNEPFLSLADQVCLYSETSPTQPGSFWHYDEVGMPKVW